ncbi:MAG: 4Fe-4S binding protein [Bradymonadales bacterium]|nr:4Fe-4S binding protein [Bradymonadales bacterium]
MIRQDWCKGCGFCVEFCPVHCLAFGQDFNQKGQHVPHLVDPVRCTGCNLCGMMCPDFAIWAERIEPTSR